MGRERNEGLGCSRSRAEVICSAFYYLWNLKVPFYRDDLGLRAMYLLELRCGDSGGLANGPDTKAQLDCLIGNCWRYELDGDEYTDALERVGYIAAEGLAPKSRYRGPDELIYGEGSDWKELPKLSTEFRHQYRPGVLLTVPDVLTGMAADNGVVWIQRDELKELILDELCATFNAGRGRGGEFNDFEDKEFDDWNRDRRKDAVCWTGRGTGSMKVCAPRFPREFYRAKGDAYKVKMFWQRVENRLADLIAQRGLERKVEDGEDREEE